MTTTLENKWNAIENKVKRILRERWCSWTKDLIELGDVKCKEIFFRDEFQADPRGYMDRLLTENHDLYFNPVHINGEIDPSINLNEVMPMKMALYTMSHIRWN